MGKGGEGGSANGLTSPLSVRECLKLLEGSWAWGFGGIEREGLRPIVVSDGPAGVSKVTVNKAKAEKAICYPAGSAMASTWNVDLESRLGQAMGLECREHGVDLLLAPAMNIKRNPRCGRNFEYFSEDPVLSGNLAKAFVMGIQSQGVGACLKHFLCNSQETFRTNDDSIVDEKALHDIYLRNFKIAIEAKPWSVMCSYNQVNGVYASAAFKEMDQLRKDGFDGIYISDWGAVRDDLESIKAGLDLIMPGNGNDHYRRLLKAYQGGLLDEKTIRARAGEVIRVLKRNKEGPKAMVGSLSKAKEIAYRGAAESIVLLKNDGILPLDKAEKISVIGYFAKKPKYQGGGSAKTNPLEVDNALEGLRKDGVAFSYALGFDPDDDENGAELAKQALATAKGSDTIVLFLGLPFYLESESIDRDDLSLPQSQLALLKALESLHKKLVLVIQTGSPVLVPAPKDIDAILLQYPGGSYSGQALADVLTGRVDPSGHLAETFPKDEEDVPLGDEFPALNGVTEFRESVFVGYRFYDTFNRKVAYPFGFGLSYTTFSYTDFKVREEGGKLVFSFCVQNSGNKVGKAVPQIYVSYKGNPGVLSPKHELLWFGKTELRPKERRKITVAIPLSSLSHWSIAKNDWDIVGGVYGFELAQSSRDVESEREIHIDGSLPKPSTIPASYRPACPVPFTKEDFQGLYKRPIPSYGPDMNDDEASDNTPVAVAVRNMKTPAWLKKAIRWASQKGVALNMGVKPGPKLRKLAESGMNSPFRMSSAMGWPQAKYHGFVELVNGHIFKGLFKMLIHRRAKTNKRPRHPGI